MRFCYEFSDYHIYRQKRPVDSSYRDQGNTHRQKEEALTLSHRAKLLLVGINPIKVLSTK